MNLSTSLKSVRIQRGLVFGIIILTALVAFEIFNYSTTDYALRDLLGDLKFMGFRWATILSIAFCGIDFAGIARIFTPEKGAHEPTEVWYLFGAWMLAATMNAILTWWGVSIAIATHTSQSIAVVSQATITKVVPIFVALMVWLIRILIIGSLSYAGERMFSIGDRPRTAARPAQYHPAGSPVLHSPLTNNPSRYPTRSTPRPPITTPEPTYQSVSARPASRGNNDRNMS